MRRILSAATAVLLLCACMDQENQNELKITDNSDKTVVYNVELAQTWDEMRTGLMNRDELAQKSGMLFDFRDINIPASMWMKDTKIGLDMLFMDKDGSIYWIYENAEPQSTYLITAPLPSAAVLEINAGDVKK